MHRHANLFYAICIIGSACSGNSGSTYDPETPSITEKISSDAKNYPDSIPGNGSTRAIHVLVALCDNRYQGIVPVPSGIGNGQDPGSNLYWGAGYGVKTFFTKKSNEWQLLATQLKPGTTILERLVFKHRSLDVYMLADAYDGKYIRQTTVDFLKASSGRNSVSIETGGKKIYFGGSSDLLVYIGHNGLMDFSIKENFPAADTKPRDAIILACYSKKYFSSFLRSAGATPVLWTTGLMAPEAYTLHDAIHEWVNDNSVQEIRMAGARAYAKYQKCGVKAAGNLLVQGF